MVIMDARSEARLMTVSPDLAAKVRAAADTLAALGTHLLVVSGLRTPAEQDALYEQGRTTPGHIVTNAKAGQSMHNYGLAVDVVPYLSGESGDLNWHADTDHFQMGGLPANPTAAMEADYGAGDDAALQVIWTNCGDGKYEA
jgi:peptidoglycan LD-endopeptidase CwlK